MFKQERPKSILTWYEGDILTLHLSSDSNTRLETHANELFARTGILIFVWLLASIPWLLNINSVLEYFVGVFNPCVEECLNLYQPEKWSELRWIISGFLGLMTITPLINRQIWVFSRPGLTDSEQRMLLLVLILSPIIFLLSAYITIIEVIPILYDIGHQIHDDYGFVAKYDAVSLIYFAIMLLWVQTLVIISSTVMVSSGMTGNLDASNANWWRLRVYGFISLISILSHYERSSSGLVITVFTLLLIELIARPWTTKKPRYNVKLSERFTQEGDLVSTLNLVCGCVKYEYGEIRGATVMKNVCRTSSIQDDLLKLILNHRPSNLIINHCDNYQSWDSITRTYDGVEVTINNDHPSSN